MSRRKLFVLIWFLFLVFHTSSFAALPSGFPDKELITKNPQKFWMEFGKAATRSDPYSSNVDKAKMIVNAIDKFSNDYGYKVNATLAGRVRYFSGDERCETWRNRLLNAFSGAGIPESKRKYVSSFARGPASYNFLDVNCCHVAPAVLGDDGNLYVFDVWQQGYDSSSIGVGSVKGVGSSRYNGMLMKNWTSFQNHSGRPKVEIDDNSLEVFIQELSGETIAKINKMIKNKSCQKRISIKDIKVKVDKMAKTIVTKKYAYDPYLIIRNLIRKGDLECRFQNINTTVMLVLDTSGSMSGQKLADAKKAAKAAINSMAPDIEIGIMSYSGSCSSKFPILPFTVDRNNLFSSIDTLSAEGGTPMTPAIYQAAKAIQAKGHGSTGKIILLCDGQNDCSGSPVKAAEHVFKKNIPVNISENRISPFKLNQYFSKLGDALSIGCAWAQGPISDDFIKIDWNNAEIDSERKKIEIRIYTVGFQVTQGEQKVLDEISKACGGKSASAKDMESLTKAFENAIHDKHKIDRTKTKPPVPDLMRFESLSHDEEGDMGWGKMEVKPKKERKAYDPYGDNSFEYNLDQPNGWHQDAPKDDFDEIQKDNKQDSEGEGWQSF